MIRYKKDTDLIATLTLDMSDKNVNIINYEIGRTFLPVIKHLLQEKAKGELRGVIITSAKKSFLAGGDIDYLYQSNNAQSVFDFSQSLTHFLRDLESPGVPVVAAINGSALGSGFELAMACHWRVVINNSKTQLGYPEVMLGLMPGSGGVVRLLWQLGLERAFPILTEGYRYSPQEAFEVGMVDALASDEDDMIEQARHWLLQHREGRRVWDTETGKIPFGTANDPAIRQVIRRYTAELERRYHGNYAAPQAILNTLAEGSEVDFDTACRIQSRYFTKLLLSESAKNMIKVFWYDQNTVKAGAGRPKGYGRFRPRKIGIIGAGQMGSSIAYACAAEGLEVVLKDISKPVAELGKQYAVKQLEKLVKQHKISENDKKNTLKRIFATEQAKDFEGCDLVIEAVFESQAAKTKALREVDDFLDSYTFIASNTSSIPITKLSQIVGHPENFIGIHFFPPADEMPLVEIVRGKNTSEETIARAFDFLKIIKKNPIVVLDNPGFYVGRVQNIYILEGISMLAEGYEAALIENIGLQIGMPKGALATADDLSLRLVLDYEQQAATHYGSKYVRHPAVETLQTMVNEFVRMGKNAKAGYYNYDRDGNRAQLWDELAKKYPVTVRENYDLKLITDRLLLSQVLEAVWCLQEGIVHSVPEANIGSVYGWGFPSFHGGVLQFVNSYGTLKLIARCDELAAQYGQRFRVPKLLRDMAAEGRSF